VRRRAQRGELLFGAMDTYLIWKLTEGVSHLTDATNAARTVLYDIAQSCWDDEICGLLDMPQSLLPAVRDCTSDLV
jgi:glycerol kinase